MKHTGDLSILQKIPPDAIEAEIAVLGSILIDPDRIVEVAEVLAGPQDFSRPANALIYSNMLELYDQDSTLDINTLNQRLLDHKALDASGGLDYLVECATATAHAGHAVLYAKRVRDKARVRDLMRCVGNIATEIYENPENPDHLIEFAERELFSIFRAVDSGRAVQLKDILREVSDAMESDQDRGLQTGFRDFDTLTGGLQSGEMVVIAARPSMGKTAFVTSLILNMGCSGIGIGMLSLEMPRKQVVHRLLSVHSGVDLSRIHRGTLNDDEFRRFMASSSSLHDVPIFVDDNPNLSAATLRMRARRLVKDHGVRAIIIDYLQLMTAGTGRSESRQVEVSDISRTVKAVARELRVPVVVLSQLNRANESRPNKRPFLSDLRESGAIEQDADVVCLLHREDYYHKNEAEYVPTNMGELHIAKQRNGPTGTIDLIWDTRTAQFKSAEVPTGNSI